jgi:hypothetical protein
LIERRNDLNRGAGTAFTIDSHSVGRKNGSGRLDVDAAAADNAAAQVERIDAF